MAAQTAPRARPRFSLIPKGRIERREALWFYFFISPWIIGYLIFTLGPIVYSGYLQLHALQPGHAPGMDRH